MFSKTFKIGSQDIRVLVLNFINSMDMGVIIDYDVVTDQKGMNNFRAGSGCYDQYIFNLSEPEFQDLFIRKNQKLSNSIYGFIAYDAKNLIENVSSQNNASIDFPVFHFFVPQIEFVKSGDHLSILSHENNVDEIWKKLLSGDVPIQSEISPDYGLICKLSKDDYSKNVRKILGHIQRGDVYELNYCHEITISDFKINPADVAIKLNNISPNPFSAYYKLNEKYLICASPEGFLQKKKNKLISTPIKGTAPRSNDAVIDKKLKNGLLESEKERAENVMIVDLVRNDLSRIAKKGTVKVDELFGVYSFKRSHQLISTVSCELEDNISFFDIIKSTFPMGSMTGAPKLRAMQLIDEFEDFKRGIFSGTVGYINPDGDFKFNVVIRSITYDEKSHKVAIAAGGAITASSQPLLEYEETILKLKPQLMALGVELNREAESYLINND